MGEADAGTDKRTDMQKPLILCGDDKVKKRIIKESFKYLYFLLVLLVLFAPHAVSFSHRYTHVYSESRLLGLLLLCLVWRRKTE
ncbi:hypothetical protein TRSC58_07307 [Trypanosoma rangeli SC58]|uniref:Uncharacterized protein n=1 Tax=Trypanosoma rangeli SC58 TaxID=429131 RepID=A0A061IVS3_TRYRA|nr:hypothetical protein TRSC58_07307 [Trypanosoma rangeli SC58]